MKRIKSGVFGHSFSLRFLFLVVISILVSVESSLAEESTYVESKWMYFAVTNIQPNIKLDFEELGGVHFFSSKPKDYVGPKFGAKLWIDKDRIFTSELRGGLAFCKSSFLLNWEIPDEISFEPLDCNVYTIRAEMGGAFNFGLGPIHLLPTCGINLDYHWMSVHIDDEKFVGHKWKFGLYGGGEAQLHVGKVQMFCGITKTFDLGKDATFVVDDVEFKGEVTKAPREIYIGMAFRGE